MDPELLNQLGSVAKSLRLINTTQLSDAEEAQRLVARLLHREVTIAEVLLIQRALGVESLRTALRETEGRAAKDPVASSPKVRGASGDNGADDNPDTSGASLRRRGLFGQIALREGYITEEQLFSALGAQQEEARKGKEQPLGVLLGKLGYISKDQMREVMRAQFTADV